MNYNHVYSTFVSIMIGASLLLSDGLIAELANANMYESTKERTLVQAKTLDVNNDGLISLKELTSQAKQSFKKQMRDKVTQIDKTEYTARLLAMFNRMDRNSDGMLDDVEISGLEHRYPGKDYDSIKLHEKRLYGSQTSYKLNESGLPGLFSLGQH